MRTLHFGLRVADRERSLAFYAALGYEVIGSVPGTSMGDLTMIKLPGDAFVTIELVSGSSVNPPSRGDALSHVVIKVESMDGVLAELAAAGITPDEPPGSPDGSDEFRTAWITDPDGNRIELVQWPPGHPDGITAADWPDG
jgi:lactoylglutathione lyase